MILIKLMMVKVYMDYWVKFGEENVRCSMVGEFVFDRIMCYKFELIIFKFDEFDKWDGCYGWVFVFKYFMMVKCSIMVIFVGECIEIDFWNVDFMSLFVEMGMWMILSVVYKVVIEGKCIWFVVVIDVVICYVLVFCVSFNFNGVLVVVVICMIMMDKCYIFDFVGVEMLWVGYVQLCDVFSDNGKEFVNDFVEGIMWVVGIIFNCFQVGCLVVCLFIESFFYLIGLMIVVYFEG